MSRLSGRRTVLIGFNRRQFKACKTEQLARNIPCCLCGSLLLLLLPGFEPASFYVLHVATTRPFLIHYTERVAAAFLRHLCFVLVFYIPSTSTLYLLYMYSVYNVGVVL